MEASRPGFKTTEFYLVVAYLVAMLADASPYFNADELYMNVFAGLVMAYGGKQGAQKFAALRSENTALKRIAAEIAKPKEPIP